MTTECGGNFDKLITLTLKIQCLFSNWTTNVHSSISCNFDPSQNGSYYIIAILTLPRSVYIRNFSDIDHDMQSDWEKTKFNITLDSPTTSPGFINNKSTCNTSFSKIIAVHIHVGHLKVCHVHTRKLVSYSNWNQFVNCPNIPSSNYNTSYTLTLRSWTSSNHNTDTHVTTRANR